MVGGFGAGIAGGATVAITIKAIDDFSKEFRKAETNMQQFGKIAVMVGKTSALAFTAFTVSAIKAGLQMQPIQESFKRLAKESGRFLIDLNEATRGTVSNFELMSNANKALLLGLDQEALPDLFKNAMILGRAAGRTTTEAITDITLGIGRQSRMILDNLGIIVKAEDANRKYAESLGITASALTEEQKNLAWVTEAFAQTAEKGLDLADVLENDVTVQLEQLTKKFEDFRTEFGLAFIDTFSVALPKATKDYQRFGKMTGEVLGIVALSLIGVVKSFQIGILAMSTVITSSILVQLKIFEIVINGYIFSINLLLKGIDMVRQAMGKEAFGFQIGKVDITSRLKTSVDSQIQKMGDLVDDVDRISLSIIQTSKNMGQIQEPVDSLTEGLTKSVEEQTRALTALERLNAQGFQQANGDLYNPRSFSSRDFENRNNFEIALAQSDRGITVNIENLSGIDPEEIARALNDILVNQGR